LKLNIIHRHCEPTPGIDQAIKEKAKKIDNHFSESIEVTWTCHVEPEYQESTIMVHLENQYFYAAAKEACFYKTIDQAYKKMERQIHDYQEKQRRLGRKPNAKQ